MLLKVYPPEIVNLLYIFWLVKVTWKFKFEEASKLSSAYSYENYGATVLTYVDYKYKVI